MLTLKHINKPGFMSVLLIYTALIRFLMSEFVNNLLRATRIKKVYPGGPCKSKINYNYKLNYKLSADSIGYANILNMVVINAPIIAVSGIVIIQAQTIFLARAHFTADNLFEAPTPIIDVDIT